MSDGYKGLERETSGGCLFAALVGFIALLFDLGRVIGDPEPGTENAWWRQIPVFVPTLIIVVSTFLIIRGILRRNERDDS